MQILRPAFLVVGLVGSVWLGVFLARQLGEMLRIGFAGTMKWRFWRGHKPFPYWALFLTNGFGGSPPGLPRQDRRLAFHMR